MSMQSIYEDRGMSHVKHSSGRLRWYLVQCVGRSDQFAQKWLTDQMGLDTYYPMVRELRPLPRNRLSKYQRDANMQIMRPQTVPFLPRYVFVRFDIGRSGWHEMFKFAGIAGLHCADDRPAPISDYLIDDLRANEIGGAIPGKTPMKYIFKVGERVRVAEGPFASFYAEVEKLADVPIEAIDPDTRIKVTVDLFGRKTTVELEVQQLAKLD